MAIGTAIAKVVLGALNKERDQANRRVDALRREIYEELLLEMQHELRQIQDRLASNPGVGDLDERAALVLCSRVVQQAFDSATTRRRRMMVSALTGVFEPDLVMEEKSRVLRAIEQLEPSDMAMLRSYASGEDRSLKIPIPADGNLLQAIADAIGRNRPGESKYSYSALIQTGCLVNVNLPGEGTSPWPRYEISALGRCVVKFLQSWHDDSTSGPTLTTRLESK